MDGQEIEPGLVTSVPKSILWGDDLARPSSDMRTAVLDQSAEDLRHAIRDDVRSDLERLMDALGSTRTRRHVVPLWIRGAGASDGDTQRTLNNFPDMGQWVLEAITAWADPAATADLQANLTLDQALPIPIPIKCSKTAVTPLLLGGLPVQQQDTAKITTTGGVAADRGAVLLIFKREG